MARCASLRPSRPQPPFPSPPTPRRPKSPANGPAGRPRRTARPMLQHAARGREEHGPGVALAMGRGTGPAARAIATRSATPLRPSPQATASPPAAASTSRSTSIIHPPLFGVAASVPVSRCNRGCFPVQVGPTDLPHRPHDHRSLPRLAARDVSSCLPSRSPYLLRPTVCLVPLFCIFIFFL